MSWGGLFGGIGNVLSTYIGSKTAEKNTRLTNQANRDMAEFAYQKDLEMWNLQNKYNAPSAQMARFKDAGLNPHLIFGQGSPGNATGMPSYKPPRQDFNLKPALDPGSALEGVLSRTSEHLSNQRAKELLAQDRVQTSIKNATASAVTERAKAEATKAWYESAIVNAESMYKEFGVDNAPTMYKVIFTHMLNNPDFTTDEIRSMLTKASLGKEAVEVIKALGLGSLIGNRKKTKTTTNKPKR